MLVAKRKLNLFGRTVLPEEPLTNEEVAKWREPKYRVSLEAHLNLGWVEDCEDPKPAEGDKKPDEGFEFRCKACEKNFKSGRALAVHERRAHPR